MTERRVIGFVLMDVRTLEYCGHDRMTHDIMAAHRFPTADEAHKAKREYQQVRELVSIPPPPLTRGQRIGRAASYTLMILSVIMILYGAWGML